MIKLCTQVNPEGFEKRLRLEDDITLLGSCFVDNISAKLRDASFHVHANPFGTLYNPASIANAVRLLDSQDVFTLEDCVQMGAGSEKICSFHHHTSFARESAEEFLANANQSLLQARENWHKSRWVIITLGTAFVWTHDGAVVANCLKRPAKEFEHRLLSLDEICSCIRSIIEGHDDKEFLFTVSPIRHMSLGAHANTLSKSLLHIALEQCGVPYFPAYEIVLDELRDYRFYAEDLVHPSPTAVEIIWEKFLDSLTLPQERAQIERNEKKAKPRSMSDELNLVRDLAVILISAGVFTIISRALKQPLILGYIVAGFLIGPSIGFFPGISSMESVHQWSEIGIIFMMFGLGLEFSFKKLVKSGSTAIITSACKLLGMFTIGFVIGQALGWTKMESIFLGGMLPMSSTMVVAKSYDDMGLKGKPFAGIVFGTLIIEDIIGIVLMVLFSTIAVSAKFSGGELFGALGKLAFFLVLWFLIGIYVIPTLLKKAKRFLNDEILLIVSIGLCFGMVALAEKMGFSSALGAFIMGSILAETIESEHIERLVTPIKDLFGAVFFVSVGMMVSPQVIAQNWVAILVLVVVLLVFDSLFVSGGVLLAGRGLRNAVHTGFSLAQLGEFGFIIASLGVSLGAVSEYIYPVIVAVFVISNLIAPFFIKASEPAYQLLCKRLPAPLLAKLDEDQSQSPNSTNAEKSEWKKLLKSYILRIMLYGVVLTAINLASGAFLSPLVENIFPNASDVLKSLIITIITIAAMAPFLYGMGISSGSINSSAHKLIQAKPSNRWPIMALTMVRTGLVVGIVISVIAGHFKLAGWTAVLIIIGGVAFILLARGYMKRSFTLEKTFFDNLNGKENEAKKKAGVRDSVQKKLTGYDVHLEQFEVPSDSSLIGKKLKDIPIRALSGANIIEIHRGSRSIIIPSGDQVIYPYDKLLAVGSSQQIESLKEMFREAPVTEHTNDQFKVTCITIDKDSQLYGKTLRSASLRDYKCMVISVLRDETFITNPKPDFHFELGDKVWLAGEKSACEWIR